MTAASAPSPGFRMLQIAVYGMGVLLFVGMIAFGVALWWKTSSERAAEHAETVEPALVTGVRMAATPIAAFDPRTLPVPSGTRIVEMDLDGATLMLRLQWVDAALPGGTDQEILWLYDLSTHKVIGEFTVP